MAAIDDEAFLRAIRDDPDADAPRLVYADWLDEHGQGERAEFIRVQIERARLPEDDDRQSELQARERRLLVAHGRDWLGPVRGRFGRFHRGFVESAKINLDGHAIPEQIDPYFQWGPLRRVLLGRFPGRTTVAEASRLADYPELAGLRALGFEPGIDAEATLAVLASPYLAGLERLELGPENVGEPPFDRLVAILSGHPLRALQLWEMGADAASFRVLFTAPFFEHLLELDLRDTPAPEALLARLAAIVPLGHLARLRLGLDSDSAGLRALLGARSWGNLRSLGWPGGVPFNSFLGHPGLAALSHLELSRCPVGPAEARRLAECPHVSGLTSLDLSECRLTDEGVRALVVSPHLQGLRRLDLANNWADYLTADAARAIARSTHLTQLRELDLSGSRIGDAGVVAIAESQYLTNLTSLDLYNLDPLDEKTIEALVNSPSLCRLTRLGLGYATPLSDDGLRMLLEARHIAWPGFSRYQVQHNSTLLRLWEDRFGDVYWPYHFPEE